MTRRKRSPTWSLRVALFARRGALASVLVAAGTLPSCDDPAAAPTDERAVATPDSAPDHRVGQVVAVDDSAFAAELESAMIEARRSCAAARRRWSDSQSNSNPSGGTLAAGDLWSVKWAAPVIGGEGAGRVEHVWVRPLRWTSNRIEGVLLSEPARNIGARRGELVGFPADELSDWLLERLDRSGRRERVDGGFTIAVIERRAGR